MKLFSIIKKIFGTAVTLLLALLLAFNLYTIAARRITGNPQPDVLGYSAAIVISGSMSDCIEVNDMVVIHREADYVIGDVITYLRGSTLVTHRIVGESDGGFVTKGDANNTEDLEPVQAGQIVGKVVWVIPKIGAVIGFLQTPPGVGCLVLAGFGILTAPMLFHGQKEEEKEETEDEA